MDNYKPWILLAFLSATAIACASDDDAPAGPCATTSWQQPTRRFPVGSTFLLPAVDTSVAGCTGTSFRLTSAPAANQNAIIDDAEGGVRRFTPHVAGDYRFARDGVAEPLMLTVTDEPAPFHNYNYYPTRSLARVGDELWVANVYAPSITRVAPATGAVLGAPIPVGAWPVAIAWAEGMDVALVAQRGSDELGVVDVATHRIADAIHVGDEPANVVVAEDGATAYVALASAGEVAVVDVAARRVSARIPLLPDLLGLALAPDGTRLYAARHRSGQPGRFPFPDDPVAEERDVFVIDTTTRTVVNELVDVGSTIKALHVAEDGATLYVAGLTNDTEGALGEEEVPSFVQEVKAFRVADLALLAQADLSRQESSTGDVVSLHGLAELDGRLWVAAEGIDAAIALDPITLAEVDRSLAAGRPRFLLAAAGQLFVHGVQGFVVTRIDTTGTITGEIITAADPRPEPIARGQRYFTGQGRRFATTWSCNSCHADGLTDTLVWNAGPLVDRVVARPFVWLEGTYPLGWSGYMYDVFNYAFEVNSNVGIRPVTQEATDLGAYLASLMPPPAANDWTERDGRLDEAGRRGEALFTGAAGCATCHALPLATSREQLAEGVTEGVSDVPGLVGAYRFGTWLKHGEARDLRRAVEIVHAWLGGDPLDATQLDDLTHYLRALTGRDFFVLTSKPRAGDAAIAIDRPVELTFSLPVWGAAENLARVTLVDATGADVDVDAALSADGRHLTLTPAARLGFDTTYRVVVDAALESWDERQAVATEIELTTASAPALELSGELIWTVQMPGRGPDGFDPDSPVPVSVPVRATKTASGATLTYDLGQGLVFERHAVIDGDHLVMPPSPVPIGPSFADTIPDAPVQLVDADRDGRADTTLAAGTTLTISGPGFIVGAIAWQLARPATGCEEGTSGNVVVNVDTSGAGVAIGWDSADPALALHVTDPAAIIPQGPGPVSGGASYWILQAAMFPTGFEQPILYGTVPAGAVDGGAASGATFEELVPGKCYKVTVTTTAFQIGSRILRAPQR